MEQLQMNFSWDDAPEAPVGDAEVLLAAELLQRYRAGKSRLDARLCEEARWWQSRFGTDGSTGEGVRSNGHPGTRPSSAWLFSGVCNKHADLCDALPTPLALPRDPADEAEAAMLSDILPVIAARCDFPTTYAANAWSKLKHGVAMYGVFWNPTLECGVGDIDICRVDVRNLFWEPGVEDMQDSPHVFLVGLADTEGLMEQYPCLREARFRMQEDARLFLPESGGSYMDGHEGSGRRTAVVDWYYKKTLPTGRTVLHYAKFADGVLLYASENQPDLQERGWYEHGLYPFVPDVLYPEDGTPAGFGLIAVGRNPQGYVDELDGHILEYANQAGRVRYWAKRSLGVNEKDFLDPDKRIIEVEGDIDEEKLRQITLSPMDGMLCDIRQMKIEELKETSGNRDVSQGVPEGGVTAASAIATLKEAGDKGSRDMIAGTYRAYVKIMQQVIELMRQFYDGVRCFRIDGEAGERRYVRYTHTGLQDKPSGRGCDGETLFRHPAFDIEVRAERQSPLDRTGRNELMLELFRAGFFDPARASAARIALSGMDFEGKDAICLAMGLQATPPDPPVTA